MADVRFQIWPLAPGAPALSDFDRFGELPAPIVRSAVQPGILDGLTGYALSQPLVFALAAMALLIALVVLVQSLAILAFGLDRLLGRFSSRPQKKGGTTKDRQIRRWLRSLWKKSGD